MTNKNSSSPSVHTSLPRRAAGLWASAFVLLTGVSLFAQNFAAPTETAAKIYQCGPISETIEYLMWLLRQL